MLFIIYSSITLLISFCSVISRAATFELSGLADMNVYSYINFNIPVIQDDSQEDAIGDADPDYTV